MHYIIDTKIKSPTKEKSCECGLSELKKKRLSGFEKIGGGKVMDDKVPAKRVKLLIVEDSALLLRLYSEEFSDDGYIVQSCLDGQQALEFVKNNKDIDAIILDAVLPMMDGRELCRRVKKSLPATPVIINSAYDHLENDFKRAGAEEYIVKSSNLSFLKATVKKFMQKKESLSLNAVF